MSATGWGIAAAGRVAATISWRCRLLLGFKLTDAIFQYPDLLTGTAARGRRGNIGRLLGRGLRVAVSGGAVAWGAVAWGAIAWGAIARGAVAPGITAITTITGRWISSISRPSTIVLVVIAAVIVATKPF